MFLGVNWVVMDWNCDNMGLNNDWIWDLHWHMNWEGYSNFFDDWDFNLLVDGEFFNVMMVNSVNVVWNRDLNVFAAKESEIISISLKSRLR